MNPTFPELAHLHPGRPAVVIGKGPSLDAWLACGCPQPAGAVRIGVNHVGGAVACDYNVSVHDHVVLPDLAGIPGRWLTGLPQPAMNPNTDWPQGLKVQWRPPPDLGFYMTFTDEVLGWSRERLALLPWLYVHSSSVQPAIHLAWYLGCASLMLVGIDGGRGQSQASQAVPGGKSAPQDYGRFQPHTTLACDRLFGNGWRHWMPPAGGGKVEARMANEERWKYEGIYGPGGLPGYGHSNHGANALEWLVQRHTRVLDVGCGHNEFVKAWRKLKQPEPTTRELVEQLLGHKCCGVDFACRSADLMAPATALPFTDGQFDLVTAFDVLEHLPEHEVLPALREMARVSRWYCFSIATAPSRILWQGQNLHPTVRPLDWWHDRIREAGGESEMGPPGYVYGRWRAEDRETLRLAEEEMTKP